ncbi:Rv2629 family ribosome hibernation factor [Saccharothrix obliqua]|uniref:Rv2629 family ribosome hibernation factor n=1 Tax=Saccharothrix obliqua TaxID=2861747 RepID=UPI001C5F9106|nr:Vms1/Ankzf1 family peptidyl-tRNA hydrolase [Saccharothrix obliqua]MBW4722255.1 hypothetical protein [Saccharothrix obliqua]
MSALEELVREPGPFATVYLDASHDTEDAAKALELRWRGLRAELEQQGADAATLDAIGTALGEPVVGKGGRAVVAAAGRLLLDEALPRPPAVDSARWSRLPHLLPLAKLLPPTVPHVVVVADRAGADLHGYGEQGEVTAEVRGRTHPLHKIRGGGWAHRRIQNTVEETAQRNAARVAEEADRLVADLGARLLVLGGEVQARAAVRRELGPRAQEVLVEVEGGSLGEGADDEAFDAAVRSVVAQHQYGEEHDVVTAFTAESGRDQGLAVQGMERVVAALREANVDALLVADRALDERTVWAGDDPAQVAVRPADLKAFGVSDIAEQPADEALASAATAIGARVVFADEVELWEGVGALLRHT